MPTIQQLDDTSYAVENRGTRMVLVQTKKGWRVKTRNAATRVWGLGGESWKDFDSLADVEAKYKSWKGIAALVEAPGAKAH
ncbi:hypothetical protein IVE04_24410 [Pseudomonas mendocina]|jgi:hypothetical protein|nr:hypothetical protein [Pseudomonas sp. A46]MBF8164312.1 hypothetical protein [Pseudomonas mendocina]OWJ92287.1 hypothetical protein B6S59_20770 [Pseudomonas sp. A46]